MSLPPEYPFMNMKVDVSQLELEPGMKLDLFVKQNGRNKMVRVMVAENGTLLLAAAIGTAMETYPYTSAKDFRQLVMNYNDGNPAEEGE